MTSSSSEEEEEEEPPHLNCRARGENGFGGDVGDLGGAALRFRLQRSAKKNPSLKKQQLACLTATAPEYINKRRGRPSEATIPGRSQSRGSRREGRGGGGGGGGGGFQELLFRSTAATSIGQRSASQQQAYKPGRAVRTFSVRAPGTEFRAHRAVLAACSEYFLHTLLTHPENGLVLSLPDQLNFPNPVHPRPLETLPSAYNENILLAKAGLARENPGLSIRPKGCGHSSLGGPACSTNAPCPVRSSPILPRGCVLPLPTGRGSCRPRT
ncbi:hypothetical protein CRUP_030904 [Coryphaenoides rupestris]|nr:hypothetical protein CRUP_030904 [Coryphaenoides rupestris]